MSSIDIPLKNGGSGRAPFGQTMFGQTMRKDMWWVEYDLKVKEHSLTTTTQDDGRHAVFCPCMMDPNEDQNVAEQEPRVVASLKERMHAWIAKREAETGLPNPMETNLNWHGARDHDGPFTSSQQAYDTLHIGDPGAAARLQARDAEPETQG